jgi:cation:H+ antiporter
MDTLGILGGLAAIIFGSHLLVDGATNLATALGVSQEVIGLTLVAVGTSLPELAAILAAVRRGEADLAVGNVAGSNVFNLLFVLATTAVVRPVQVSPGMVDFDFVVLAAFSLLAFPILSLARRIGRFQGALMLAAYAAYVGYSDLVR